MSVLGTDIEEDLVLLDARLKQLRLEYEQYFMGARKREPQLLRGEVQKIIAYYANVPIRNTGHRFKFNNLRARFFAFRRHWDETQRKIEDGRSGSAGTTTASTAGAGANKVDGRAFDLGVMYTFGPAAVSLNYINGENDDCPAAGNTATCAGDDEFSMLSLAGKYTLGPGVSLEATLWHAKVEGNNPTTNTDENEGTGGIVGIVLVF